MREDFLHYIWQYKIYGNTTLQTVSKLPIRIVSVGMLNTNSGPDFFNSQLYIGDQLWAGNVEVHIKSSDWFVHNHENDLAYDNVILHVVWEHDVDVHRKDGTSIPTLELKNSVSAEALSNYKNLFNAKNKWINCEDSFSEIPDFTLQNWLERLYFERLERKSKEIEVILKASKNNWEAVLFKLLAKNFGLKVNGEAFYSVANSIDFSIIRKESTKALHLEALFFGQSGMLHDDVEDVYFKTLQKTYAFLKQKHSLNNSYTTSVQFFRLRPLNFPTIRLSQFAQLYSSQSNLFSKILAGNSLEDWYNVFCVSASEFWNTHYTFNKTSKKTSKPLTKSFIDLLIINTILPILFCYTKHQGKALDSKLIDIIKQVSAEKNTVVNTFLSMKRQKASALQSQAYLELKTAYCDKNKCLQCAIGHRILTKKE